MKKIIWIIFLLTLISSCWQEENIKKKLESNNVIYEVKDQSNLENVKWNILYSYNIKDKDWNLLYSTQEPVLYDYDETWLPIQIKSKISDLTISEIVSIDIDSDYVFSKSKEESELKLNEYNKEDSFVIDKKSYQTTKNIKKEWEVIEDWNIWNWRFVVMSIDRKTDFIRLAKRSFLNPLVWYDIEELKKDQEFYLEELWLNVKILWINKEEWIIKIEKYFNPFKWKKLIMEIKREK